MADKFDEMATKILPRHSNYHARVAQALRDVERETAEICVDIVTDSHTMGEWDGDCRRGIREKFSLEY